MHITLLNPVNYRAVGTYQTFDEMSWIERYQTNGEFKITTFDDITLVRDIPIGTFISHSNTREVMIVENHEIKREGKKLVASVSGRSYETFFENRGVSYVSAPYDVEPIYDSVAGADRVYTIHNVSGAGAIIQDLLQHYAADGWMNPLDAILFLTISLNVSGLPLEPESIVIKRGDLYSATLDLLKAFGYGIKTTRPLTDVQFLDILIHDGNDLSSSVIFSALEDDFTEATYFTSSNKSGTASVVVGKNNVLNYEKPGTVGWSGSARKVKFTELNEDLSALSGPEITHILTVEAMEAVGQPLDIVECKVSESADPVYRNDYNIGDIVTVQGEFGTSKKMRVTEYIESVDKNGIRGYPSLDAV